MIWFKWQMNHSFQQSIISTEVVQETIRRLGQKLNEMFLL